MQQEPENITLNDLRDIFNRRRRSFIIPAISVFFIAVSIALALPPVYKSTATILIEEQEIPPDFVVTTVTSLVEQRLQTINQRIMTTTRLMEIMDRFNLYADDRRRLTTEEVVQKMREGVILEPISTEMMDRRTGRPTLATIAFTLSYTAKESPGTVQKVASQLTSLFLEENLLVRERQTTETSEFLREEGRRVMEQMERIEAEISAFKQAHITELPEMLHLNLQELTNSERNIERLQETLRTLKQREGYLQAELSTTSPKWHRNWIIEKDEDVRRMEFLEVQLVSLKTRYSDEYPDVIKTRLEIDDLKKRLDAEGVDYSRNRGTEAEKPENPAYISLSAQLSGVRSEIDTINRLIVNFEANATVYKKRIATTPMVEKTYNALLSRQANTRLKHNDLLQKTMEAEVAQGLEKNQKGERFTLIDPARLPEKPFKPNRSAIVLIGLVLGFGAGVGVAAFREFADTAAHHPETLTRQTGYAVLAAIPAIVTAEEISRKKRRHRLKIIAIVVILIATPLVFHFLIMDLDVFWAKLSRRLGR